MLEVGAGRELNVSASELLTARKHSYLLKNAARTKSMPTPLHRQNNQNEIGPKILPNQRSQLITDCVRKTRTVAVFLQCIFKMLSSAAVKGEFIITWGRHHLCLGPHRLLSAMRWEVISTFKSSLDWARGGIALHWQGKQPYHFKDFFFSPYLQYLKSIGIPSISNSAEF